MQELGFRQKFDGAQDYDLTLRAVGKLIYEEKRGRDAVAHIPKTLLSLEMPYSFYCGEPGEQKVCV